MKIWIKTKLSDKENAGPSNPNKPLLNGYEDLNSISTTMVKPLSSGHILIRAEGLPEDIIPLKEDAIANIAGMQLLTEDEAEELVRKELVRDVSQLEIQRGNVINPTKMPDRENWACESCDCSDKEVNEIAIAQGLDPGIKADIILQTRGTHVLQDQENYLMAQISTKLGLSKEYWDSEANNSEKWENGNDIERDVIDGKQEAYEFVLSRIRAHA